MNATDDTGATALQLAIDLQHDQENAVKLLLEKGANVNVTDSIGFSALKTACERGGLSHGIVKILIEAGADVNNAIGGSTALLIAAEAGSDSDIKVLLEAGADVNASSPRRCTVLMTAAEYLHPRCLKLLIEAGADVNATDINNRTALIHASSGLFRGQEEALSAFQELLKGGAEVNRTDIYGQNALETLFLHINNFKKDTNRRFPMLLYAAGEMVNRWIVRDYDDRGRVIVSQTIPDFMPGTDQIPYLKHLSRQAVRKQLLHLDPHTNLFKRVHLLQLPLYIPEYLVYDMSLEEEYESLANNDDGIFYFSDGDSDISTDIDISSSSSSSSSSKYHRYVI